MTAPASRADPAAMKTNRDDAIETSRKDAIEAALGRLDAVFALDLIVGDEIASDMDLICSELRRLRAMIAAATAYAENMQNKTIALPFSAAIVYLLMILREDEAT